MIAYTEEQLYNLDLPEPFRGKPHPSPSADSFCDMAFIIIALMIIFLLNEEKEEESCKYKSD